MLEGSYVVLEMVRQLEGELAQPRHTRLARAGYAWTRPATPGRSRSLGFEATLLGRRIIARLSLQPADGGGPVPPPPFPPQGGGVPPGGWLGVWRVLRGM